jgi:hypothetical protein
MLDAPTIRNAMNRPSSAADLPEEHSELKSDTVHALRVALTSDRRAWQEIERIVREYVRVLRAHDLKADRAVAEAKALVTQATGDPMSSMMPSVVTWTLSEYYEK